MKMPLTSPRRCADPADAHGARSSAKLEDLLDLLRSVVDPGHQRRDQDAARDPGAVEPATASSRLRGCGGGSLARQAFSSSVGTDRSP